VYRGYSQYQAKYFAHFLTREGIEDSGALTQSLSSARFDLKAKIKVQRALLCYALRRLGLDTDPGARKPQDQQIVLLNREVIHEDHG
jgi:hypothetical protein